VTQFHRASALSAERKRPKIVLFFAINGLVRIKEASAPVAQLDRASAF
jgi:hypothetical protein